MTVLSADQIAQYAYQAGFKTIDTLTAIVAIGLAESSGNLNIISPVQSDGTRGYGLFQIETENLNGAAWQAPNVQAKLAWTLSDGGKSFNPWCTACAPMPGVITQKSGPRATGCGGYGSGNAYNFLQTALDSASKQVMNKSGPSAIAALLGVAGGVSPGAAIVGQTGSATNPVTVAKNALDTAEASIAAIQTAISSITSFVTDFDAVIAKLSDPQTWLRVGEVLVGAFLLLRGVMMLAEATPAGHAAIQTGKDMAMAAAA